MLFGGAAAMAAAFAVLAATVWHANEPVGLDRALAQLGIAAGEAGPLGGHPRLAHAAEQLGSRTGVGLAAVSLAGLALLRRDWVTGLVALLSPLVCFAITEYVAKPLINQPIAFGGRAFPSGHTAGVTAVTLAGLILLCRRWGRVAGILFVPFGVAAVSAVGLAVLALRFHHYPTDVLGGVALGSTVVLTLAGILCFAYSCWGNTGRQTHVRRGCFKHL